MPNSAVAGDTVEVEVSVDSGILGARDFSWSVKRSGVPQTFTELSSPVERISFVADQAGPYQVVVQGTVGGFECVDDDGTLNVNSPGAIGQDYRLRITPQGDTPKLDYPIVVQGGADAVLAPISVEAGLLATGSLQAQDGSAVPAYLRARRLGVQSPIDYETFANAGGVFNIRLPVGLFDVTVVPSDPSLPTAILPGLSNGQIASLLTLPTLNTYTGHVFDASGAPLQGARVSLVSDGAATTASISQADGSFSVGSFGTTLTGVRVAPPSGSGLPTLVSDLSQVQALTAGSDVVIRFADAVVNASLDLRFSSGAVAAGARAGWRASLAQAGSVFVGSVEFLSGEFSVQAVADANGHIDTLLVARSSDFVALANNGEGIVRTNIPWGTQPVQNIQLQTAVDAPILISQSGGGIGVVRVSASPMAALTQSGATVTGDSTGAGELSLALVEGGAYRLELSSATSASVVAEIPIVSTTPAVLNISLPATLTISGRVVVSGASSAGAQISLFCVDCQGDEKNRPLASAVSDLSGHFDLRVQDPGVAK
ncbi:MAG: carboxypeptidase regulatory-like domain-containing protein [Kofleriaceae bacterium]|nr:carboxypeptidase regulatory-like domain-containing protein [Kofleriaceae bacterium]